MAEPFLRPLIGSDPSATITRHDAAEAAAIASREEMTRDAALLGTRRSQQELPQIKTPSLPDDFAQHLEALDKAILERGLSIDRAALLELGKERFAKLLELDRKVPRAMFGSSIDATRFESVQRALSAFKTSAVPPRKMSEIAAGGGKERDAVRKIAGWLDLWKFTAERHEVLDDLYSFNDAFCSLVFGQSMLEQLSKDGRLRSKLFCGANDSRVHLLRDWLSVVEGSLVSVTLPDALWHVVAWLANEKAPSPSAVDLAKEFFDVRAPSVAQIKIARAVVEGFALDFSGWSLWQHVGRATRTVINESRLAAWRTSLAKRYARVTDFHAQLRASFFRDVGFGFEAHREFDGVRHRLFLERTIENLLDTAGRVMATAATKETHSVLVARFQGLCLVEGKMPKQRAQISAHLAAAFPSSSFELEFAEVRS